MENKFTWTRQHNILTKGTANSILRFKEGARYACPRHSSTDCWDFEFQYLPFQMPHIFKKERKQPSPLQEVFSSIHGNCIRSHAFYKISKTCWVPGMEREIVTRTLIENNSNKKEKKERSLQLLARKIRDLKTNIWILLLRTNGSFCSFLALDWTEVFIWCF